MVAGRINQDEIDKLFEGIKAIVLDFDGTIIDSVGVKDRAFESMFSTYTNEWPEIWEYHKNHDAVIRFDKFRHISETILRAPYTEKKKQEWCGRFHELVVDGLVNCPFVPGAEKFLEKWGGILPLYLASMSPADELDSVLEYRGLNSVFTKVFSHPWVKTDSLCEILKSERISNRDLLFIGDSPDDYAASTASGVKFLGRISGKPFPDSVSIVQDLTDL